VEQLRKLDGGGEHGPHAVILAPDGKSLYVVAGNATNLTKVDGSLVPRIWGEDNLLPRMVDGSGFMADEKAPGGHICRVSTGSSSRSATATRSISPSTAPANCSPTIPTWNGM
jgi:hypothetical protein